MLLWLLCYEPRYFGTISRSNLGTLGYFGAALWSLAVGAARWLGIIVVLYYPNSAMLHAIKPSHRNQSNIRFKLAHVTHLTALLLVCIWAQLGCMDI